MPLRIVHGANDPKLVGGVAATSAAAQTLKADREATARREKAGKERKLFDLKVQEAEDAALLRKENLARAKKAQQIAEKQAAAKRDEQDTRLNALRLQGKGITPEDIEAAGDRAGLGPVVTAPSALGLKEGVDYQGFDRQREKDIFDNLSPEDREAYLVRRIGEVEQGKRDAEWNRVAKTAAHLATNGMVDPGQVEQMLGGMVQSGMEPAAAMRELRQILEKRRALEMPERARAAALEEGLAIVAQKDSLGTPTIKPGSPEWEKVQSILFDIQNEPDLKPEMLQRKLEDVRLYGAGLHGVVERREKEAADRANVEAAQQIEARFKAAFGDPEKRAEEQSKTAELRGGVEEIKASGKSDAAKKTALRRLLKRLGISQEEAAKVLGGG